ncbi:hypothetical protein NCCP2165_11780 [Halomonas sp. NCCP-2165]|nr:hypothetical protein NCCP2165_11780 [Halomonas sp. NCCP-2165]
MTPQEETRRSLLARLGRGLGYAAPAMLLVASGLTTQAVATEAMDTAGYTSGQEAPLMLAEASAEAEAEGEAEAEAEAEAEGEAEGEAEAEGEGEAEGEAEAEAEG